MRRCVLLALALCAWGSLAPAWAAPKTPVSDLVVFDLPGTTQAGVIPYHPSYLYYWTEEDTFDYGPKHPGTGIGVTPISYSYFNINSSACALDRGGAPMVQVTGNAYGISGLRIYPRHPTGNGVRTQIVAQADLALPAGVTTPTPAALIVFATAGSAVSSCTRSDGAACTLITSGTYLGAYTTLTSSEPVTLKVTLSVVTTGSVLAHYVARAWGDPVVTDQPSSSICIGRVRHFGTKTLGVPDEDDRDALAAVPDVIGSYADLTTWSSNGDPITVTPNAAIAPDGTLTAVRLDQPAWSDSAQTATIYAPIQPGLERGLFEVWLRADAPTTAYIGSAQTTGGAGSVIRDCPVTTTWTKCSAWFHSNTAGVYTYPFIGMDSRIAAVAGQGLLAPPSMGTARSFYAAQPRLLPWTVGVTSVQPPSSFRGTNAGLFTRGFGHPERAVGGATFSDANHFTFGANDGPTDFAGDFMGCVSSVLPTPARAGALLGDGSSVAARGWYVESDATGATGLVTQWDGGSAGVWPSAPDGSLPGDSRSILCFGRVGSTIYAARDGGPTSSATVAAIAPWTAGPLYIGRAGDASYYTDAYIDEVWLTSSAWSESAMRAVMDAALQHGGREPRFLGDQNTVLHLAGRAFNGTTWGSPQGNLTTVGTPGYTDQPMATKLPTARQGYGPITANTYYVGGSHSRDALDTPGDRFGCMSFVASTSDVATGKGLFANATTTVGAGSAVHTTTSGTVAYLSGVPATKQAVTTNALAGASSLNVVCWWRTGNNLFVKLNLGTTATADATALEVPATSNPPRWGRGANTQTNAATLYQIVAGVGACPDTSCEAWATKAQKYALGMVSRDGKMLELNGRLAPSTTVVTPGVSRGMPAGVPVVDAKGYGIWNPTTQRMGRSSNFCASDTVAQTPFVMASGTTGATCYTQSTQYDLTRSQLLDRALQNSTNGHGYYGPLTTTTSSPDWTFSVYVRRVTTTGPVTIFTRCGTGTTAVTACGCQRDDGLPCTTTIGVPTALDCAATGTVTPGRPVRLSARVQCDAGFTAGHYLGLMPGAPNVAPDADSQAYFSDWHYDWPPVPAPPIYNSGVTTATRSGPDGVVVANPLAATDTAMCACFTADVQSWTLPTYYLHGLFSWVPVGGTDGFALYKGDAGTGSDDLVLSRYNAGGGTIASAVWTPGALMSAGGARKIAACATRTRLDLYVDGVQRATTPYADTPFPDAASMFYFGNDMALLTALDGWMRDIKVVRTDNPRACGEGYGP